MLKKCFSYTYVIFSFILIIFQFYNMTLLKNLSFVVSLMTFFIIYKLPIDVKNKKIIKLLMIVAIVIRICLVFLPYNKPFSDYENFYFNAVNFSKNGTVGRYNSIFPHLVYYIMTLGMLFKLFGVNYKIVVILNIVFDILASVILLKKFENPKFGLFWALNPYNIIWCTVCHTTILTNFFLLLSLIIISKLKDNLINNENNKSNYLLSIAFSVSLSFANLYRPIMIILIIAIIIYVILNLERDKLITYFKILCIIVLSYIGTINTINIVTRNILREDLSKETIGWSLYAGSNLESMGMWNVDDGQVFNRVSSSDKTPTEVQKYLKAKGIERYKNNGKLNNLKLFIKKAIILVDNPEKLSFDVFQSTVNIKFNRLVAILLKFIMSYLYFFFLIVNFYVAFQNVKTTKYQDQLCQLFIIGVITSHLILEVSPRYTLPLMVAYSFIVFNWQRKSS